MHLLSPFVCKQGGQQLCSVFLSCFSLGDPSDVYKALFAACKQSITGKHDGTFIYDN